jgi:hypothetical protein
VLAFGLVFAFGAMARAALRVRTASLEALVDYMLAKMVGK